MGERIHNARVVEQQTTSGQRRWLVVWDGPLPMHRGKGWIINGAKSPYDGAKPPVFAAGPSRGRFKSARQARRWMEKTFPLRVDTDWQEVE